MLAFSAKKLKTAGSISPLRVPITKPLQRSQAHAGVLRDWPLAGGNGCAVTQVGNNHAQVFLSLPRKRAVSSETEAVAGTVRTVTAQAVFSY